MTTAPLPASILARRTCLAAVLAMLILQWVWPGRLPSPPAMSGLVVATLMSLPLAVLAVGLWRGWPQARFWSGVAALFYFCHGIAEAWAVPASRFPGWTEALLSVLVVVASSWDGLRARLGARTRPPV